MHGEVNPDGAVVGLVLLVLFVSVLRGTRWLIKKAFRDKTIN
jgi:hypothetical protein